MSYMFFKLTPAETKMVLRMFEQADFFTDEEVELYKQLKNFIGEPVEEDVEEVNGSDTL